VKRARQAPCARTGCDRLVPEDGLHPTCTPACGVLHRFEAETHNITTAIGDGPATDQITAATKELIASFDRLITVRRSIRQTATKAGITTLAWSKLLRGEDVDTHTAD
jgi:hypothetical protein